MPGVSSNREECYEQEKQRLVVLSGTSVMASQKRWCLKDG